MIFLGENATSTTVAEPSEQELEKEVKKASEQNRRYIRPSELVAFLLTTFGQKNLDQFVRIQAVLYDKLSRNFGTCLRSYSLY